MIAWVSHHLPIDGKLIGGAEMTDFCLLQDAPVDVEIIPPNNWNNALDYEKIIITGTDLLTPEAMNQLAKKKPILSIHHQQTRTQERANLFNSAEILICKSPKHLEIEMSWTNPKRGTWILSPHDVSQFSQKPKENFALWAARWHNQKGPEQAILWASHNSIPLQMMFDKPREEVLETMSRAKYFVFFPNGFDAEPRALVEAILSGCIVQTNDLAGITSVPNWTNPDVLSDLVTNAKELFWETVLN